MVGSEDLVADIGFGGYETEHTTVLKNNNKFCIGLIVYVIVHVLC